MLSAQRNIQSYPSAAANPRVLLVEHDFLQAADVACVLEDAGIEVMGPCSTDQEAHKLLNMHRPDAALLNVGNGPLPSFELATFLQSQGIPFAFLTGYAHDVIPAEFAEIEWLRKPVTPEQIIRALQRLIVCEKTEIRPG